MFEKFEKFNEKRSLKFYKRCPRGEFMRIF